MVVIYLQLTNRLPILNELLLSRTSFRLESGNLLIDATSTVVDLIAMVVKTPQFVIAVIYLLLEAKCVLFVNLENTL